MIQLISFFFFFSFFFFLFPVGCDYFSSRFLPDSLVAWTGDKWRPFCLVPAETRTGHLLLVFHGAGSSFSSSSSSSCISCFISATEMMEGREREREGGREGQEEKYRLTPVLSVRKISHSRSSSSLIFFSLSSSSPRAHLLFTEAKTRRPGRNKQTEAVMRARHLARLRRINFPYHSINSSYFTHKKNK